MQPDTDAATVRGCTSGPACKKTLTCTGSFEIDAVTNGISYRCVKDPSTSKVEPTCSAHGGHNDWSWGSVKKLCYRKKSNGDRVESSQNIHCAADHVYKSASGKCVGTGPIRYGVPALEN